MCQYNNSEVVVLPDRIHPEKEIRSVSLDRCIVDTIKSLWAEGVQTLGCCCGHNKEYPSIVIPSETNAAEILRIGELLKRNDRFWRILQWRLVEAYKVL